MKNILLKSISESGKILQENFRKDFRIESKDTISNLVTEIDKKSEAKIIEIIQAEFPSHYILTEESGEIKTESEFKWIIDPIDGTINYAHSIPICCISIGLEKAGELFMGAVYNPFMDELFFAEKNSGAFLNNEKIFVSKEDDIRKSLLVTGFPYNTSEEPDLQLKIFDNIVGSDIPIRRLGSAALDLCWTANGRFDGFWEFNLNAWDVAAGALILTEAGGVLSDFEGKEYSIYNKQILATNGKIHNQLLSVIQNPE